MRLIDVDSTINRAEEKERPRFGQSIPIGVSQGAPIMATGKKPAPTAFPGAADKRLQRKPRRHQSKESITGAPAIRSRLPIASRSTTARLRVHCAAVHAHIDDAFNSSLFRSLEFSGTTVLQPLFSRVCSLS